MNTFVNIMESSLWYWCEISGDIIITARNVLQRNSIRCSYGLVQSPWNSGMFDSILILLLINGTIMATLLSRATDTWWATLKLLLITVIILSLVVNFVFLLRIFIRCFIGLILNKDGLLSWLILWSFPVMLRAMTPADSLEPSVNGFKMILYAVVALGIELVGIMVLNSEESKGNNWSILHHRNHPCNTIYPVPGLDVHLISQINAISKQIA